MAKIELLTGTDSVEALQRSNQRWHELFFGVWGAVHRRDPTLTSALLDQLEALGFVKHGLFTQDLFAINPSTEVLRKVKQFNATAEIPPLRGRTRPRSQPAYVLYVYAQVYGAIKDVRYSGYSNPKELANRMGRNFKQQRLMVLRNRLAAIVQLADDGSLNRWSNLRNREVAKEVTAQIFNISRGRLDKILVQASKDVGVRIAKLLRGGVRTVYVD